MPSEANGTGDNHAVGQQPTRPDLSQFRLNYPLTEMKNPGVRYTNDCVMMSQEQGLLHLEVPADASIHVTYVDDKGDVDFFAGRYLWVVTKDDGLHALETKGAGIPVGNGKIKHSNLTAGGSAHGGGELWYWKDKSTVVVNAHSGRYGTRGPDGVGMAQALVNALKECGFKAATTGIEQDTNVLRAYPDPEADLEL